MNWADEDLSYLGYDAYEAAVRESVAAATRVEHPHQVESRLRKSIPDDERAFAVEYSSLEDFKTKAKRFGIFPEWKDGVPQGAYRGVVTFKMLEGRVTVHFTPSRMVPIVESHRRLHPTP